jgi:hypothetical protein
MRRVCCASLIMASSMLGRCLRSIRSAASFASHVAAD